MTFLNTAYLFTLGLTLTTLIIPSKTAQNLLHVFTQHLSCVIPSLHEGRKLHFTLMPLPGTGFNAKEMS
jgi:hypothetical protein